MTVQLFTDLPCGTHCFILMNISRCSNKKIPAVSFMNDPLACVTVQLQHHCNQLQMGVWTKLRFSFLIRPRMPATFPPHYRG